MPLRICLVTPFAWSQPHDVNEHVAGVAGELRELGHSVTVLAPSGRARDLAAGRRALLSGQAEDVIAIAPTLTVAPGSSVGIPVGMRAAVSYALSRFRFDVVHGFEPGMPSLSYLALRDARALASRRSSRPTGWPTPREGAARPPAVPDRRAHRHLAGGRRRGGGALPRRFPHRLPRRRHDALPPGKEAPPDRARVAARRPPARARGGARDARAPRLGAGPAAHEAARAAGRSSPPPSGTGCTCARRGTAPPAHKLLNEAMIFVPSPEGLQRVRLEAQAAGAALAAPPDVAQAAGARSRGGRPARGGSRRTREGRRPRPRRRRARELRRGRGRARPPVPRPRGAAAPLDGAGTARRPRVDPLRPAHAHVVVARLLDRAAGAGGVRGGDRPRRDRRHRPQRLRRRARSGRGERAVAS